MRILALKSSFVLVEWINILAEVTQSGRVYSESEASEDIKHFLMSALKECVGGRFFHLLYFCSVMLFSWSYGYFNTYITVEEDGVASAEKLDPVVLRIERIVRDQLNCTVPFDNQTMDHVGALVGAYLDLSMENYRQRWVFSQMEAAAVRQLLLNDIIT
jgi:hypothetical protein